jgi:two-component system, chemotaxis family, CheB/CheR fusion protein
MAFVFVQHLDPTHGSMLCDLLARTSPIPAEEAQDGRALEPDRLYVIRPNTDLAVDNGVLKVTPRTDLRGHHMPIDSFFRALARDQGSAAIGIVLSGTASDGAQGLAAIKAEGGITFAQDARPARSRTRSRSSCSSTWSSGR